MSEGIVSWIIIINHNTNIKNLLQQKKLVFSHVHWFFSNSLIVCRFTIRPLSHSLHTKYMPTRVQPCTIHLSVVQLTWLHVEACMLMQPCMSATSLFYQTDLAPYTTINSSLLLSPLTSSTAHNTHKREPSSPHHPHPLFWSDAELPSGTIQVPCFCSFVCLIHLHLCLEHEHLLFWTLVTL